MYLFCDPTKMKIVISNSDRSFTKSLCKQKHNFIGYRVGLGDGIFLKKLNENHTRVGDLYQLSTLKKILFIPKNSWHPLWLYEECVLVEKPIFFNPFTKCMFNKKKKNFLVSLLSLFMLLKFLSSISSLELIEPKMIFSSRDLYLFKNSKYV